MKRTTPSRQNALLEKGMMEGTIGGKGFCKTQNSPKIRHIKPPPTKMPLANLHYLCFLLFMKKSGEWRTLTQTI